MKFRGRGEKMSERFRKFFGNFTLNLVNDWKIIEFQNKFQERLKVKT